MSHLRLSARLSPHLMEVVCAARELLTYNNVTHLLLTYHNLTHLLLTYHNVTHLLLTYHNVTHLLLTYLNVTHLLLTYHNVTHLLLTYHNLTHLLLTYHNLTHLFGWSAISVNQKSWHAQKSYVMGFGSEASHTSPWKRTRNAPNHESSGDPMCCGLGSQTLVYWVFLCLLWRNRFIICSVVPATPLSHDWLLGVTATWRPSALCLSVGLCHASRSSPPPPEAPGRDQLRSSQVVCL